MKSLLFLLPTLLFLKCPHIDAQTLKKADSNIDYCLVLDSLTTMRNTTRFSSYANRLIPKIEKVSGIEAHCNKGFFGHIYRNEQQFNSDITNWRNYFKCVSKTIILIK